MTFEYRSVKILFILLLLVDSTGNVHARRPCSVEYRKGSHIRGNLQARDFSEDSANVFKEIDKLISSTQPQRSSGIRMRTRNPTKRRHRDRMLSSEEKGWNSDSSGTSGGSSDNAQNGSSSGGSGGSSRGSGWGWDENGSYCGCLCNGGGTSGESGVSCEYAVYANNTVDSGGYVTTQVGKAIAHDVVIISHLCSYISVSNGNDEQNQDEDENQNGSSSANENTESSLDQSSISEQQTSDAIAVVSSSDSEYDPYVSFEIQRCDTFSKLWINDLDASCKDGVCTCTFAEQLVSQSRLSCSDASNCPTSCPVCLQCISQICGPPVVNTVALADGRRALPAVISLITLLLAGCVVVSRAKHEDDELAESLMETDDGRSHSEDWMVPINTETGLPTEKGKIRKAVWLAPATVPVPQATMLPLHPPSRDKKERKETVMLVVVPKPSLSATSSRVSASSPDVEKESKTSIFPDLLKDSSEHTGTKGNIVSCTPASEASSPASNDTSSDQCAREEFSPGLWVVPLSNESVASSISASVDHTNSMDDGDDDEWSNDTPSTSKDMENSSCGKEENRSADESTETDGVIIHGSEASIMLPTRAESKLDCPTISSTVTDISTISSLDAERSIGSWEGEI
jgi:hypothetical protein